MQITKWFSKVPSTKPSPQTIPTDDISKPSEHSNSNEISDYPQVHFSDSEAVDSSDHIYQDTYSDSDTEPFSYLQMDTCVSPSSSGEATDNGEGDEMEVEPSVEVYLHPQQYTEQHHKLPFSGV